MGIKSQSQAIKNHGSALKRASTTIRALAATLADAKKHQVLFAAAQIIDNEAAETQLRAQKKAAEERRYEDAFREALPAAKKLAASLPMANTAQKLAVLDEGYNGRYMIQLIAGQHPGRTATRETMQRELDDALREIANSLAHRAAKVEKSPEINDGMLQRLEHGATRVEIVAAAAKFDHMTANEEMTC